MIFWIYPIKLVDHSFKKVILNGTISRLKLAFETAEELLMDTANSQGCQRYDPLAYDIMDEDFHAMMDPVVAHVFNWPSLEVR